MVQQMSKFTPHVADKTKLLRDLLSSKNQWTWTDSQQQAFELLKTDLSSQPVLALYNPDADTRVAADASSFGLGAVLTQKQHNEKWLPVACASHNFLPLSADMHKLKKWF